jgi:hypothetical protein
VAPVMSTVGTADASFMITEYGRPGPPAVRRARGEGAVPGVV